MWYGRFLLGLYLSLSALPASAIVMPEVESRHLRIGLESLRVQYPDMDREGRKNYMLSYHGILQGRLGYEAWLMLAPDTLQKSEKVDIKESFYSVYASLSYDYIKLFRYSIMVGPGLIYQRITSNIVSSHHVESVYTPGLLLRFAIDYAVNKHWETSLQLGFQERLLQSKLDWSYGVGVLYKL